MNQVSDVPDKSNRKNEVLCLVEYKALRPTSLFGIMLAAGPKAIR